MIKKTLNNLRSKPDHVKDQIALGTSIFVTVVIFLFWLSSFGISLSNKNTASKDELNNFISNTPTKAITATAINAFSSFIDLFSREKSLDLSSDPIEILKVNNN